MQDTVEKGRMSTESLIDRLPTLDRDVFPDGMLLSELWQSEQFYKELTLRGFSPRQYIVVSFMIGSMEKLAGRDVTVGDIRGKTAEQLYQQQNRFDAVRPGQSAILAVKQLCGTS